MVNVLPAISMCAYPARSPCQHLNNTKLERGSLEYLATDWMCCPLSLRLRCEIFSPPFATRGRITSGTGRSRGCNAPSGPATCSLPRHGPISKPVSAILRSRSHKLTFRQTADNRHGELIKCCAILPYMDTCFVFRI